MPEPTVFITPDDACHTGHLFGNGSIRMPLPGFDMMIVTKTGRIPMERKAVPGDLISSVHDGRLYREIVAMREVSPYPVVIFHGQMIFDRDGVLVVPWRKTGLDDKKWNWDRIGIRNLKRSLWLVHGVIVEEAWTDGELVSVVRELQEYFDGDHGSMRRRPNLQSDWLIATPIEKVLYFYSGLPDIKSVRARALLDRFPRPADLVQATVKDIATIKGIGKKTATRIYDFLHNSVHQEVKNG